MGDSIDGSGVPAFFDYSCEAGTNRLCKAACAFQNGFHKPEDQKQAFAAHCLGVPNPKSFRIRSERL
jgi:hypothetical protein